MSSFKLDDRFAKFLPDFTASQNYQALKQSILFLGKCLASVIVWKQENIILDGHHRVKAVEELRAEGKIIRDPEIEYVDFASEAEAKLFLLTHQEATRPNWSEAERVFRMENDLALVAHFSAAAKQRMLAGKKVDPALTSDEGSQKGTVLEQKAKLVGMGKDKYSNLVAVIKNPAAFKAVQTGQMTANAAAKAIKGAQDKVQEQRTVLQTRQILPDWSNTTAQSNSIVNCDVLKGFPLTSETVDLIVTSFPYPVSNEKVPYIQPFFNGNYMDYLLKCRTVLRECWRVMRDGRYCVINIDNCGPTEEDRAKGIMRYNCYVDFCRIAQRLGFTYADEYIWYKQKVISNRCMAGSKQNPRGQRNCEFVLVFFKPGDAPRSAPDDLTTQEWFDKTLGMWEITPDAANHKHHVAPFPLGLPQRAVQLWSRRNEVVLDPFVGSGTTCEAAISLGRQYIGLEINPEYCRRSEERLAKAKITAAEAAKVKHAVPAIDIEESLKRVQKWERKKVRAAILSAEQAVQSIPILPGLFAEPESVLVPDLA